MRLAAAGFAVLLAFACGPGHSTAVGAFGGPGDSGSGTLDAGAASGDAGGDTAADSGAPADDAGALEDAGAIADAGSDAGPFSGPVQIEDLPCPSAPKLLWSRTFTDEVDFRGSIDGEGNLYWIEYDPPPSFTDAGTPWLASADSTGADRYRVPLAGGSFEGLANLAEGKFIVSHEAVISALDPVSGAPSWTIDLSSRYPGGYASASMLDAGGGRLVFELHGYNQGSGLYFVDAATGAVIRSLEGTDATAWSPLASNGAGTVIATANPSSICCNPYHQYADYVALDSSGNELWRQRLEDAGRVLAWPDGGPWISVAGYAALTPMGPFTAAPSGWFKAAAGAGNSAAFSFGTYKTPDLINLVKGGIVVAQGGLEGSNGYDGEAVYPWIAGDHVALVSQNYRSIPALCHPSEALDAYLSHFDAAKSWQCSFNFQGETAIEAVVPYGKELIVERRTYVSDACGTYLNPVTIEGYDLGDDAQSP